MKFNFRDIYVSKELKFSVGIEEGIKKYYVSFLVPTHNRQSDYEIYYWLPASYLEYIYSEPEKIYTFILECDKGLHKEMEIDLT